MLIARRRVKKKPALMDKKVLMVAPEPFFEPRGTPYSEYFRIKALLKLGYKVELLTYPIGENIKIDGLTIRRSFKIPFIKKVKIGFSFKKLFLDFFLFLWAFFRALRRDYLFLHTHEEAGYLGAFLKKFFKIPHLYDMHSSLPQQMINFKTTNSKLIIGILKKLEKFVLKNSDSVIVICKDLEEHARKILGSGDKLFLIENFLDEVDEPSFDLVEKIKKTAGGREIALYTGTLEPYQGIELLIEAANYLKEGVLILIVGGEKEQIDYYKKMVKNNKNNIIFWGKVEKKEIPSFIEASSVLLSPRRLGTNTPLKIYSYMKSGKPIVATKIWSHEQILSNETSILVEPDGKAIAEGIKKALSEEGDKVSFNAKRFANNFFTEERYLELVRKAVSVFEKEAIKL